MTTFKVTIGNLVYEFRLYSGGEKMPPRAYDGAGVIRVGTILLIPPRIVEWQLGRYGSGLYFPEPWEPDEGELNFLESKLSERLFYA